MAIDGYIGSGRQRKRVFSIKESAFVLLNPAHETLRRATGLAIDPYGTTLVSPEHAAVWSAALRDELPKLSVERATQACQELLAGLQGVIDSRQPLLIEGE
jgi:hypothetical protein